MYIYIRVGHKPFNAEWSKHHNNMKKFAVLKQLYNYSPRVLEMFDEREDAELYVTLMKKTNKDTDAFEYNVFEMSK